MKRKNVITIGSIISNAFTSQISEQGRERYMEHNVLTAWQQVLRPTIANYTTDFSFVKNTITVRILSPALRQDLFMQRSVLIEKLNTHLNARVVFAIVLR